MHTLKLLFMAMVIVVGTVMQLNAQTPEEKPQPPVMPPQTQTPPPSTSTSSPEGHGIFFNINIGGQSREQTFTESATFPLYNETGAVATTHAIGGSAIFDLSVGMRVWRNLGVAIGYSSFKDDDDAGVTARVPHPVLFQQPRTETTTASLEHTENVVHLQFMWTIPYREQIPACAHRRPFVLYSASGSGNRAGRRTSPTRPFTTSSSTASRSPDVKDSPVGVNIGAMAATGSLEWRWSPSAWALRALRGRIARSSECRRCHTRGRSAWRRLSGRRRSPTRVLIPA